MIDQKRLAELAAGYGISLNQQMLQQFEQTAQLLTEWNQRINLTAITDPDGILLKHFLDSLLVLTAVQPANGAKVIDIGTGAGFPGIPLKIARPDLELTLLDSLNKRINYLNELVGKLGFAAKTVHARAEEGGHRPDLREQYDLATARAVAHLRELTEYCLPFVRLGGMFVALKGYEVEQELEEGRRAVGLLGGRIRTIKKLELPDGSGRSLVVVEKISQTPAKYPRSPAKIGKNPL